MERRPHLKSLNLRCETEIEFGQLKTLLSAFPNITDLELHLVGVTDFDEMVPIVIEVRLMLGLC